MRHVQSLRDPRPPRNARVDEVNAGYCCLLPSRSSAERSQLAGRPIRVGAYTDPTVITITGQTAVVIEPHGYTVELINIKIRRVFPPITVGAFPTAVAITA